GHPVGEYGAAGLIFRTARLELHARGGRFCVCTPVRECVSTRTKVREYESGASGASLRRRLRTRAAACSRPGACSRPTRAPGQARHRAAEIRPAVETAPRNTRSPPPRTAAADLVHARALSREHHRSRRAPHGVILRRRRRDSPSHRAGRRRRIYHPRENGQRDVARLGRTVLLSIANPFSNTARADGRREKRRRSAAWGRSGAGDRPVHGCRVCGERVAASGRPWTAAAAHCGLSHELPCGYGFAGNRFAHGFR
ncbi:hypothetical protein FHS01_004676, partial [Longimicrobium terrae]|nr:hypothetical protein [Longimicrobium terrae]MBB6072853.1 hypothetical protein [Longimicrobium terrae]